MLKLSQMVPWVLVAHSGDILWAELRHCLLADGYAAPNASRRGKRTLATDRHNGSTLGHHGKIGTEAFDARLHRGIGLYRGTSKLNVHITAARVETVVQTHQYVVPVVICTFAVPENRGVSGRYSAIVFCHRAHREAQKRKQRRFAIVLNDYTDSVPDHGKLIEMHWAAFLVELWATFDLFGRTQQRCVDLFVQFFTAKLFGHIVCLSFVLMVT